jgi:hypothetical protein
MPYQDNKSDISQTTVDNNQKKFNLKEISSRIEEEYEKFILEEYPNDSTQKKESPK